MKTDKTLDGNGGETARSAGESKSHTKTIRLAFIISHPIQYYAPLYLRLASRRDIEVKVFFTWHAGNEPILDHGFGRTVAWDIPVTDGYQYELVRNTSADPGTHHFWGLRNPTLVNRVLAWNPDVVHVTGWAWHSHLLALRAFAKRNVPTFFRGDSHLLDPVSNGPRWWFKRAVLRHVFSWPMAFLSVGTANSDYYRAFGVSPERLFPCTHSIDVRRFAEPADDYEREAAQWREQLNIPTDCCVVLFAGKFERKKRPIELMRAMLALRNPNCVLIMVGNGDLEGQVQSIALTNPDRFRVLPFQNQTRMPVVYRLGDLFVLPSAYGETWGLAVNEAMASGRPVLVSDRVGCAVDVIDPSCGRVFNSIEIGDLTRALNEMTQDGQKLTNMRTAASERSWLFDISRTELGLVDAIGALCLG